mmetsp:Transcript_65414/g.147480  ORF Transcript_65414/g.147480 Transcript_65414/m.147480 type:complete len:309 (+) Transcript_65414:572-1498(+)
MLHHCAVADVSRPVFIELAVILEEGMWEQHRQEDVDVQPHPQRLGHHLEGGDVAGVHPCLLPRAVRPNKLKDVVAECQRHFVVGDVPPHLFLLLDVIRVDVAEVRHGRCDAADKRREGDQREDDHADRENALHRVGRTHLHGRRRELRQRPVQRSSVEVAERRRFSLPVHISSAVLYNPCVAAAPQRPQCIPRACNEVVHNRDPHCQLGYAQDGQQRLGLDVVRQLGDQPHQLHEPEEAYHAQDTDNPQRLASTNQVQEVHTTQELEVQDPIDTDYDDVHREPCPEVACGYPRWPHLDQTLRVEAHKE